jgi:hypothetical protein
MWLRTTVRPECPKVCANVPLPNETLKQWHSPGRTRPLLTSFMGLVVIRSPALPLHFRPEFVI